jgi:hypothetical protein
MAKHGTGGGSLTVGFGQWRLVWVSRIWPSTVSGSFDTNTGNRGSEWLESVV